MKQAKAYVIVGREERLEAKSFLKAMRVHYGRGELASMIGLPPTYVSTAAGMLKKYDDLYCCPGWAILRILEFAKRIDPDCRIQ